MEETLKDAEGRMKKTEEVLRRELATVRTGRASPALLEGTTVDYYGTPTPLNQLAGITAPEPHLVVVQPWDKGSIPAIEKGILKSDLGLTPSNDGSVIRLPIPALTEQRRKELVRLVHKRVEEDRVALRNVRRDALEHLRRALKNKEISEDEERRAQERLERLTEKAIVEVDKVGELKEAEILEI
ncbi:MAG: ribosome recycling factor [Chloroflexi bacterium]|nr:ribosome recycling factor [Chloroflexota bacterium]